MSDKINANAPGYDAATPEWFYEQRIADLERQLAERDAMLAEFEIKVQTIRERLVGSISISGEVNSGYWRGANRALQQAITELYFLMVNEPDTAQANAKIIEAAEEQEYARRMASHPHDNDYLSACYYTNEAVRAKRELKP